MLLGHRIGHSQRLGPAILGNGFTRQNNGSVVLRQSGALRLARFARFAFPLAATATIPVTITAPPAASTIAVTVTAIAAIGLLAGSSLYRGSRRRSFSVGAVIFRDRLAGQQHRRKVRSRRWLGFPGWRTLGWRIEFRLIFGLRPTLRLDLFGIRRAGQTVDYQSARLKAAQFALFLFTRDNGFRVAPGRCISGLVGGNRLARPFLGFGGTGLGIRRTVAGDAVAPSASSPAAAASAPLRRGCVFARLGLLAFGFTGSLFRNFLGIFFARLRFGEDQTVGLGQGRSGYFHIPKFAVFVFVLEFQEVGDIEERVAFQSNIDKCRLHARKHAGYATFVNGAGQRVFVLALEVNLGQLIVFHQRHFGFMRRG